MQLERQNRHMEIIREWEQQGTYLIAFRNMLSCTNILRHVQDRKEFTASADTIYVNSQKRVFLAPKALRFGMMRYLQTTDISVKRIVKELEAAEALITYEKGNELTQKINGKRCYVIDMDGLDEYCEFFRTGVFNEEKK